MAFAVQEVFATNDTARPAPPGPLQNIKHYPRRARVVSQVMLSVSRRRRAALLLATAAIIGLVGSLIMPTVVDRAKHLWVWPVVFGALSAIGYLGLLVWPAEGRWVWAVSLGIGGMAFATAIALIPARSVDHEITARLSGFVQPVGYILAGVGPMLVGVLYSSSQSWTSSLVFLVTLALCMAVAGALAARDVQVDNEL